MLSPYTRTRLIRVDGKKCRAHRVIMERHLGRKLSPTEHIHHINKNPLDNRLGNLQIVTVQEHNALHQFRYPENKICQYCGAEFMAKPHKRKRQKCCSPVCGHKLATIEMGITRYKHPQQIYPIFKGIADIERAQEKVR